MVAHPGEVLDTSTTDKNDGVFLQIVSNSRNICSHFYSVDETDTRNFAQGGVRLLGCGCVHPSTYPSALRTSLQSRTLRLVTNLLSARTNQLIEGRQTLISFSLHGLASSRQGPTQPPASHSEKPFKSSKGVECCQANSPQGLAADVLRPGSWTVRLGQPQRDAHSTPAPSDNIGKFRSFCLPLVR
jgi:hypothetical protein